MSRLLRTIIRSNTLHQIKPTQTLPFLLRHPFNHFSTEPENPQPQQEEEQPQQEKQPQQSQDSSVDPFLHSSNTVVTYGKLRGNGRFTLKTDVIHMLDGCELSPPDIRVLYDPNFNIQAMVLQFQSGAAFNNAMRLVKGKGQLYGLDKIDRGLWESASSYEGRGVLLQGLARNTTPEDVERILCGFSFNTWNLQLIQRPARPDPIKLAVIEFASPTEAMRAVLLKNRSFCNNSQISMRVLQ